MTLIIVALAVFSSAQDPGATGVSVTTWQVDTHRTGRNLNEGTLVSPLTGFGQICNVALDGQVYAQPLIETNVGIAGTVYPVVSYVVTQNDSLYAINGVPTSATCSIIDYMPLLPILSSSGVTGVPNTAVACTGIGSGGCPVKPVIGILGTPVISVSGSTGTIYLVTYSQDSNGNYYHYLHAINIRTFAEESNSPVLIAPPGQSATLFSQGHIQRPGLLFADGYIYATFSMIDGYVPPYPNGAVFGYNASRLTQAPLYFQTTVGGQSSSNGGGIWQGGAAPAYGSDSSGTSYIYLKTANGTYDGVSNWGDSFLKLSATTLTVGQFFTPADQYYRSASACSSGYQGPSPQPGDMDFGSGGVMLIPDANLASWPYLAVGGDKEGGIWFNDRTTPATPPHVSSCDSPTQTCNCSAADGVIQTYWTSTPNYGQVIHNTPAYWQGGNNSYLYVGPSNWGTQGLQGNLVRYPLCSSAGSQYPIDATCGTAEVAVDSTPTAVSFPSGVTPAISAAPAVQGVPASDAIVWAIWADGSTLTTSESLLKVAQLYAFDAADVNAKGKLTQLFSSGALNSGPNAMTTAATKFSVPTVADGCVYIGTQGGCWCRSRRQRERGHVLHLRYQRDLPTIKGDLPPLAAIRALLGGCLRSYRGPAKLDQRAVPPPVT
jgi:hypothetical protein